ncbi:MAG: GspE/PulE family protein [Dehalococcoidales bacterium]
MTIRQEIPVSAQTKLIELNIQPEIIKLVPETMARRYRMMPLEISGGVLRLAMADPTDVIAADLLSAQIHMYVNPEIISSEEIEEAIDFYYKSLGEDLDDESQEEDSDYASQEEIERQVSMMKSLTDTSGGQTITVKEADSPIIRALSIIMNNAVIAGASDIHFQPQENELLVRYRVDGSLHDVLSLPSHAARLLVSRIKILANLNIADHRRPQDGQFSIERSGNNGQKERTDIRVGIIPSAHGESVALRLHDTSKVIMELPQLGFLPDNLAIYQEMLKVPHGIILVSGPTGAGKTTTLYASLNSLDCMHRNIITIEDPVEYDFNHVTQVSVNVRAGLTFAIGLRSVLRVDPDVILIGEIRDAETAQIAVQSALTGHLVLSSIHANDAVGVVARLLDLGIQPFLIASALTGVLAQRMVRKICPHCAQKAEGSLVEQAAYTKEVGEKRSEFYYGVGCDLCNSGFKGRTGIFEILRVSDKVRTIIANGGSSAELQTQAFKEGMAPLIKMGMQKVRENVTTPSEVLRNAYSV